MPLAMNGYRVQMVKYNAGMVSVSMILLLVIWRQMGVLSIDLTSVITQAHVSQILVSVTLHRPL
jgi:hypothetical protein